MELTEAVKIALQSLWANKLRSILTLMGVMIGVAAVIMVITLVNGANKFVATKVYGYGADVFTASKQPSVIFSDAEFNKYQKRKDLKIEDYREVAAKCKDCADTGAMASTTGKVVYYSHSSTDTSVRGGERKGKTLGQSEDDWVAMPITTFLNAYGSNRSVTIYARAHGVGDPL